MSNRDSIRASILPSLGISQTIHDHFNRDQVHFCVANYLIVAKLIRPNAIIVENDLPFLLFLVAIDMCGILGF